MKIKELFADPENWTTGYAFRCKSDNEPIDLFTVLVMGAEHCKFCLLGAIEFCYPKVAKRVRRQLRLEIEKIEGQFRIGESDMAVISYYNDCYTDSYNRILNVVEKLDL